MISIPPCRHGKLSYIWNFDEQGVKEVEKKHNENWHYDEEEVKIISEQIMDAYHSGAMDHDELYYDPKREIGE
jgi:hypothetical protein